MLVRSRIVVIDGALLLVPPIAAVLYGEGRNGFSMPSKTEGDV